MPFNTTEELSLIWNTIKAEMEEKSTMSTAAFETWFADFRLIALENNKIVDQIKYSRRKRYYKCSTWLS